MSLKVAYWADAEVVGTVSPQVFVPRPRVESALVRVVRRARPGCSEVAAETTDAADAVTAVAGVPGPGAPSYERLFAIIRAGFGQRRKMLRRALEGVIAPEAFEEAGVLPTMRAEQLSLEEWCRLAAWMAPSDGSTASVGRA